MPKKTQKNNSKEKPTLNENNSNNINIQLIDFNNSEPETQICNLIKIKLFFNYLCQDLDGLAKKTQSHFDSLRVQIAENYASYMPIIITFHSETANILNQIHDDLFFAWDGTTLTNLLNCYNKLLPFLKTVLPLVQTLSACNHNGAIIYSHALHEINSLYDNLPSKLFIFEILKLSNILTEQTILFKKTHPQYNDPQNFNNDNSIIDDSTSEDEQENTNINQNPILRTIDNVLHFLETDQPVVNQNSTDTINNNQNTEHQPELTGLSSETQSSNLQ